ncbi:DnaD domain-containing protein [Desulforamulus aquiferis]|uniref:DnaD domain protein n=1 Tax=Desulforamulus aquiferis TaxID=1397668 RepID=A0AAW7ZIM3_9FIRM|nr:DnaD domain protein [Desulforamulus aquiferis]MDO7789140.1 DnaD domain protein [Desulforamulus aquiferis]
MNYLKEILAFHTWLETNPLDTTEQALWFHLMDINNKCGWLEWFAVANMTLQARLGIDRKTLDRKRLKLIQKGRIEYVNQGKREAGKYRLISFQDIITGNIPLETVKSVPNNVPKVSLEMSTLYKLNETKQIDHDDQPRPNFVTTYEQEFGRLISPGDLDKLKSFVDDGMSDEVVCEAIRRTRAQGKTFARYAVSILNNWRDAGVINMAGVARVDAEYEQAKGQKSRQVRAPAILNPGSANDEKKKRLMRSMYL